MRHKGHSHTRRPSSRDRREHGNSNKCAICVYAAGMGIGFAEGVGQAVRPDGAVRYRADASGRRVGVLPATCKRGLYSLAETGYSHTDNDEENLLRITCPVCLGEPLLCTRDLDHQCAAWRRSGPGLGHAQRAPKACVWR